MKSRAGSGTAPASRSFCTTKAFEAGIEDFRAAEPPVVGRPAVSKLSLTTNGIPSSRLAAPLVRRRSSPALAWSNAFGLRAMIALIRGPFLSKRAMRSR